MALEGQDLPRTHLNYHEESVIIILLPSETKSQRCGGVDRGCHGSHSCDEHMQGTFHSASIHSSQRRVRVILPFMSPSHSGLV